ncbi:hypothetical protein [Anaerophaga thermohalophila]|uniref:hypothetical protein n=1 Tax=Anaerophaga thermohalophila TaxID=177400 RepID=UPI001146E4A4|nr:hypothetical protein [Anaerophaga thermohalophila]
MGQRAWGREHGAESMVSDNSLIPSSAHQLISSSAHSLISSFSHQLILSSAHSLISSSKHGAWGKWLNTSGGR